MFEASLVAVGILFLIMLVVRARPDLTGVEARSLVAKGARLIDVRSVGEFGSGKLPGAVNIPLHELGSRISEAGTKEKPVVLYCQSGMRSARAARMLRQAGYTTVRNLGAMSRW